MFTFAATSVVHVLVPVAAKRNGSTVDPTADTVQLAFLTVAPETASPASGDWKAATWETNTVAVPNQYAAKCLVGPGGTITLTAGIWWVWVKITDSPETPAIPCGRIKVTP